MLLENANNNFKSWMNLLILDLLSCLVTLYLIQKNLLQKTLYEINQQKIVDQIRCLGIDMIHEANSGHPGIALGAAPIITTLYNNHMVINPKDEKWVSEVGIMCKKHFVTSK